MKKLSDYARNVYSQFGEDGIIEQIFQIRGTTSRVCVEFGAYDGILLSNTANLWKKGWRGILIEANKARYKKLVCNTKGYDCICINAYVSSDGDNTIDDILERAGISSGVDLLSIDIDGDDYYILESLKIKPRLIVCEFNPTVPADMELVPEKGNHFGCSALSLIKLAEAKGYRLVAANDTNCFFVRIEDVDKFADYEKNIENLVNKKYLTYLISGQWGNYVLSNKPAFDLNYPAAQKFVKGEIYRFNKHLFRRICGRIYRWMSLMMPGPGT
jgi:hypothetical protein